jgi:hypothetical protein
MQTGSLIKVNSYRENKPSIEYGVIQEIRNIHVDTLTRETFKRYVITRSQYLITLKDKAGNYRSYYDKFLNYQPVSFFKRLWLKIRGKV